MKVFIFKLISIRQCLWLYKLIFIREIKTSLSQKNLIMTERTCNEYALRAHLIEIFSGFTWRFLCKEDLHAHLIIIAHIHWQ